MPARTPGNSARFARARDTDLTRVMARLGGTRDRYDREKWRIGGHVISLTGAQFYDHTVGRGGGGAIDLVMHLRGATFREALDFLDSIPAAESRAAPGQKPPRTTTEHGVGRPGTSRRNATAAEGQGSGSRSVQRTCGAFSPPLPAPEHWQHVRAYLTEERGVPGQLVDTLHKRGLIYADGRHNAVFPRRDEHGAVTGAALRGTSPGYPFKGMAPGTERDHGWFYFGVGEQGPVQMVLTESAIDAMSYCALRHGNSLPARLDGYRELYVSTDGAGGLPRALIDRVLERGGVVRGAFDRDVAGERLWQAVRALYPGAAGDMRLWRDLPTAGSKDWNEMLVARVHEHESPGRGR